MRPMLLALLVLSGCALRGPHAGLVRESATGARLETPEGRLRRLVLDEDARPIARLDGCAVRLEGPRLGPVIWVNAWTVTDGGDGSVPYVGILRDLGARLVLEDRNSGHPLYLADGVPPELRRAAGGLVLLTGYVVGAQELRVVQYRLLAE